jgi:hypothetical protein
MISRASTIDGTPASIAATVMVPALESVPSDRHEATDRSDGWDPLEVFGIGLFGLHADSQHVVDQTGVEHRAAGGSTTHRNRHRLSRCRAPLSPN